MAERELICQMLLDNSIIPSLRIQEKHFLDGKFRKAYNLITKHYDAHGGADKNCLLDANMAYDWVQDVLHAIPTAANFTYYEDQLLQTHKREFQNWLMEEGERIRKGGGDVISFFESKITDFSADISDYKNKTLKEILSESATEIERRYNQKGKLPGITTGNPMLDIKIGGWQKNFYYVIAARPSDGKSAELMNFAIDAAKAGHRIGYLSAESANEEMGRRIFAREGRVPATNISLGFLTPVDFDKLMNAAMNLEDCDLVSYDEPAMSITVVERKAREFVRRNKIQVLFIDYIQYITGGEGDKKNERIADISLRIKTLARRLHIPIIAAAQLKNYNRDRRPSKDDVAETDQILRDADGLILIHHVRDDQTREIQESELIIDKARDGETGVVPVIFEGKYLNFKAKEERNEH